MACSLDSELPGDLRPVIRALYQTPYETFSRFLEPTPHILSGPESLLHIKRGWGLGCLEKVRALAHCLTERGYKNRILVGAMELWHGGVNLMQIKGDGSEPPNEAHISQFFDSGSRQGHDAGP